MRLLSILTTTTLALTACSQPAPAALAGEADVASRAAEPSGAPPLDADGIPRLRPGLYEVVQVADDEEPETTRECLGENAHAELREILTKAPTADCKISRTTDHAGLQVATECRQNGMTNRLRLTVAGNDSAYRMALAISVTTPSGETSSTQSVVRGRRLGDCPQEMAAEPPQEGG